MRYYDPQLGRYLSSDPIGIRGGDLNLYAYVRNRPTRLLDPLGLLTLEDVRTSAVSFGNSVRDSLASAADDFTRGVNWVFTRVPLPEAGPAIKIGTGIAGEVVGIETGLLNADGVGGGWRRSMSLKGDTTRDVNRTAGIGTMTRNWVGTSHLIL